MPEAGLINFRNPQKPRGLMGRGTDLADQFLQIRLAGDMALLQAVSKRVLDAERAAPGTVLDRAFIDRHCSGFVGFAAQMAALREEDVLVATGLTSAEIDELAQRYIRAERVIITWAMGIWEKMPAWFLDALGEEFGFEPPRKPGVDSVDSIKGMRDGSIRVLVALGGNLVHAISDTEVAEDAVRKTRLSVQISTKLNRSHAVTGEQALILPALGRTEIDVQGGVEQFVTVEDTVCPASKTSTRGSARWTGLSLRMGRGTAGPFPPPQARRCSR